jgi:hypothetical protein
MGESGLYSSGSRNFWAYEWLLVSQEGLCFMKLTATRTVQHHSHSMHVWGEVSMCDTAPTLIILHVWSKALFYLPHKYYNCHLELIMCNCFRVRVRVTLQLTVSQSVSLGVEPNLGLLTSDFFFFFLKVTVLSFGGALSDERSGLSFISPCQYSHEWSVRFYINYLQSVLNTGRIYNI